jgi:hypothetical protein
MYIVIDDVEVEVEKFEGWRVVEDEDEYEEYMIEFGELLEIYGW